MNTTLKWPRLCLCAILLLRLGRFLSPDPLMGNLNDPQSLNLYAYVRNDPQNMDDPRVHTQRQKPDYYNGYYNIKGNPYAKHTCTMILDGAETDCARVFNLIDKGNAAPCHGSCFNVYFVDAGPFGLES